MASLIARGERVRRLISDTVASGNAENIEDPVESAHTEDKPTALLPSRQRSRAESLLLELQDHRAGYQRNEPSEGPQHTKQAEANNMRI